MKIHAGMTGFALFAAAGALAVAPAAQADDAADFYKDHPLTIVVGFSPGGGADHFARFFSKFYGKHIPGHPNVIVQNMPGAGGLKALNHVYAAGAQDGSRTMLTSPSHTLAQLLGKKAVKYDIRKLKWIGTLTQDTSACAASGSSGVKSIMDTKDRELIVGATGPSSSTAQHALLLKNLLGLKIRVVTGYRGTAKVRLAMETGEVQAVCAFWASQALGPQKADIESGKLVPIVQMGSKPNPAFKGAPVAYTLAKSDDDRRIMRAIFGTTELSRPFTAAPGSPDDRVAVLREAFWKTVNSPELQAEAKKLKLIVDPLNAKDTIAAFDEILSTPKALVARAEKVISEK